VRSSPKKTILAVIWFTAFAAGCSDEHVIVEEPPGFFVGVVTDRATVEPIDSAIIHIKFEPDSSAGDFMYAYTGADGYYNRSAGHRKARFYLFACKSGFKTQMAEVDMVGDSVKTDFELEREE